jgi:capsular exopolysaccharide synthesis family protein
VSKIFEALNNGKGELSDLIRPMVGSPGGARAEQPAETERVDIAAPATPQDSHVPAAVVADPIATSRTVALHIPAPSPLFPFEEGQWRAAEQYRILRTKIVQHPKQPRMIVVSSPSPGDGKSVTAINLAATLSLKSEARVLLVDADFRKSAIHTQLGISETPGLVDVLRGTCSLEDAAVNARELPNLYVIPAGATPLNPAELLDNTRWPAICAEFRRLFRYVVIDSPPVAAVADFDLIQAPCEGIVLVVRPDHTYRPLLRRSLDIVAKTKLLGVVVNCVPEWFVTNESSADYYYYSKGSRGAS